MNYQTEKVTKLKEKIYELEILNQRAIHLQDKYEIKNGLVSTPELDKVRELINMLLLDIDHDLLYMMDDGK